MEELCTSDVIFACKQCYILIVSIGMLKLIYLHEVTLLFHAFFHGFVKFLWQTCFFKAKWPLHHIRSNCVSNALLYCFDGYCSNFIILHYQVGIEESHLFQILVQHWKFHIFYYHIAIVYVMFSVLYFSFLIVMSFLFIVLLLCSNAMLLYMSFSNLCTDESN